MIARAKAANNNLRKVVFFTLLVFFITLVVLIIYIRIFIMSSFEGCFFTLSPAYGCNTFFPEENIFTCFNLSCTERPQMQAHPQKLSLASQSYDSTFFALANTAILFVL